MKKILFISGSVGLGHVFRDLEIAHELRSQNPDIELHWLASEPASSVLSDSGEILHPLASKWAAQTNIMENLNLKSSRKGSPHMLNLAILLYEVRHAWNSNVKLLNEILNEENYDLVVGDEAYEIAIAVRDKVISLKQTFIMMYDFIGVDPITLNPLERLVAYKTNYGWAKGIKKAPDNVITRIFIGELEDVPNKRFGFLLPNRIENVRNNYNFVGYILPFDPAKYSDKSEIRRKMNYGNEPLIVCSVGGTSIGLPLLQLCCDAYQLMKDKIPKLKMVLAAGPRISPDRLKVPEGAEVHSYLAKLYEHFAACDLAIVQGGSTTTIELTALKVPFIYFPVERHCEQNLHVAPRLERLKAGVKMLYSGTTADLLAEKALSNIGKETNYGTVRTDGSKNTARIILNVLEPQAG